MTFTTLALESKDDVAHLILNRPDAYNSLNRAFWHEFPTALQHIAHTDARVLVISSTGKHFSAGMDLDVFKNPDPRFISGEASRRAEFVRRFVLELQETLTALEQLRIPVLVAIQGGCIGGAFDLVCACDCRYSTTEAFFSIKETQLGITADLGVLQRLPTLMHAGLARELAYTARPLAADEALNAGLVNRVFPDADSLLQGVMAVAKQIAEHSPLAVFGTKHLLNYARDHGTAEGLTYTAAWQSGMFHPTDMMESMLAKAQKRPPQYTNLYDLKPIITKAEDAQ